MHYRVLQLFCNAMQDIFVLSRLFEVRHKLPTGALLNESLKYVCSPILFLGTTQECLLLQNTIENRVQYTRVDTTGHKTTIRRVRRLYMNAFQMSKLKLFFEMIYICNIYCQNKKTQH